MNKAQGRIVIMLVLALLISLAGALMLSEDTSIPRLPEAVIDGDLAKRILADSETISKQLPLPDIEIPTPEVPAPPVDRRIWHVSGEFAEYYRNEASDLEIKLIDRTTGKPITEYCKLWIADPDEAPSILSLIYNGRRSIPARNAWPSEGGLLSVFACYEPNENGADEFAWAETPIPHGYQLDCDVLQAFAHENGKAPTSVTLHYKPAPVLIVEVKDSSGMPVSGVSLLAVPLGFTEYASGQSNKIRMVK